MGRSVQIQCRLLDVDLAVSGAGRLRCSKSMRSLLRNSFTGATPWLETALFTAMAGNANHLCLSGWLENPVENPLAGSHTLSIPARGAAG